MVVCLAALKVVKLVGWLVDETVEKMVVTMVV